MEEKNLPLSAYLPSLWRVARIVFSLSKTAIIFKVIGALLSATLPIATAYLAGRTTTALAEIVTGSETAKNEALLFVAATTGVSLVWAAWGSVNRYVGHLVSKKIENTVEDLLLNKFLELDFWRYDDKETSELQNRAERFSRFFTYIFDSLFTTVGNILSLVAASVALFATLPVVGVVVVIAMIPAAFIETRLVKIRVQRWNEMTDLRRMKNSIHWLLSGASSIAETRIYGLIPYFRGERDRLRSEEQSAETVIERRVIGWDLLADVVQNLARFFAFMWVILAIARQAQPIGQFVFVQSLVSQTLGAANGIVSALGRISEDLAYLKDYDEFINLPARQNGKREMPPGTPTLELSRVRFAYPGSEAHVLDDVSVSIPPGTHLAIVGENGAGKSTLVKLILGLYRPTAGTVEVDGINLEEYNIDQWHNKIGILFQNFKEYTFTSVRNNVWFGRIGKENSPRAIKAALKRARLIEFIERLPKKEETITSTRHADKGEGTELSGGQWQRLAIARNFFREADILILDEPTSAVDAKAEAEIFDEIDRETKGKTVIIISHRFSTVRKADRIVVLDEGRIVEQGTHEELMSEKGLYKEMFDLQAKEYIS